MNDLEKKKIKKETTHVCVSENVVNPTDCVGLGSEKRIYKCPNCGYIFVVEFIDTQPFLEGECQECGCFKCKETNQ